MTQQARNNTTLLSEAVKPARRGAPKGTRPPSAGIGRKKGVPNKFTASLKAMILGALDDAGGQTYLAEQAKQNPAAFLALIGKVLPTTLATDPNSPLEMSLSVSFVKP